MAGPEPKRPRMAFEGDVDMPDAATPEYAAWAHWRNVAGSIAMSFMEAKDIGVVAANFQKRVMQQGLSVAGVDRMCRWAAPDMDQATALAHKAMYEKAEPYVLDVAARAWKRRAVQSSSGPGKHRARKQDNQQQRERPQEDPVHEEIRRLADRIRELQMPKVPPLSLGELERIQPAQIRWAWQRDVAEALKKHLTGDDPEAAGRTMAQEMWRFLYRECTPAPQSQSVPGQSPQWFAQPQVQPTDPQAPHQNQQVGPPGACFRCGNFGHWARDCGSSHPQGRWKQRSQGGFSMHQGQYLYSARTTGHTYDATAPLPYPCHRCGHNHWAVAGPCPVSAPGCAPS